ncbi:GTP-binding protein AARP2 involved in 40S ribosome biogenesis, partial [Pseudoloma neurophilia]
MFSSKLEGQKFLQSNIKSLSGIRGIIKKIERTGNFRATFEGNVKNGDTVILNTFVKMEISKYCYPHSEKYYQTRKEYLLSQSQNDLSSSSDDISELNEKPEKSNISGESSSSTSEENGQNAFLMMIGQHIRSNEEKAPKVNLTRLTSQLPLHKRLEKEEIFTSNKKSNLENFILKNR